jgi:hypothetical protein
MRAPRKSRPDGIVQKIVSRIQSDPKSRLSAELAELDVRATIGFLRELDREIAYRGASKGQMPLRGKRQENIDDFSVLLKKVKALQKALSKTSVPALLLLFSREDGVGTDQFPSVAVQERTTRRFQQVTTTLATMRGRCELFLSEGPGEHGNTDYRQRRVAHEAWRLLRRYGINKPARGELGSLYGDITSLLWQAMTAEANKDLQRACRTAIRLADKGGLRDDGPVIARGRIPLA